MKISQEGLKFIQSFEGYERALPNGDCVAYRCIIGRDKHGRPMHDGKWTIGFGCTEGVTEGMVWTRAQADEAFLRELERFEAAVNRYVTVPMTQGQYDSLVSFSYNCGEGALRGSTLLAKFNSGDTAGAARQFQFWNRSRGIVVLGLTRRRAAEMAMFLRQETRTEPDMPQTVDTPTDLPGGSRKLKTADAGQLVAGSGAVGLAGLSAADSVGYAQQVAQFIREYGVEMALAFCIIGGITFALYKYFTRQDYLEGRYMPKGGVE